MVQTSVVRTAAVTPPEQRTEEQVTSIADFISVVQLMATLDEPQRRGLCRSITLESSSIGEEIISAGEVGDKYYIILSGTVSVEIESKLLMCPKGIHKDILLCDCQKQREKLVSLTSGMGFGEMALWKEERRTATVTAVSAVDCLVITRASYEQFAGNKHRCQLEERVAYLRKIDVIEDALRQGEISVQDVTAMADCLTEQCFLGTKIVVRQGDSVNQLIFVRSGTLLMYRAIDMNNPDVSSDEEGEESEEEEDVPRNIHSEAVLSKEASRRRKQHKTTGSTMLSMDLVKQFTALREKDRQITLASMENKAAELEFHRQKRRSTLVSSLQRSSTRGSRSSITNPTATRGSRSSISNPLATKGSRSSTGNPRSQARKSMGRDRAQTGGKVLKYLQLAMKGAIDQSRCRKVVGAFDNAHEAAGGPWAVSWGGVALGDAGGSRTGSKGDQHGAPHKSKEDGLLPSKHKILYTGSLSAYKLYGNSFFCSGGNYPVSLVSDGVATVYMMGRQDVLRRLPKRLFLSVFGLDNEAMPSDRDLLRKYRQGLRWDAFRKQQYGKAPPGSAQSARLPPRDSRVDVNANLEFLGRQAIRPSTSQSATRRTPTYLSMDDEQYFCPSPSKFYRRFEELKHDADLQESYLRDGLKNRDQLGGSGGLFGEPGYVLDADLEQRFWNCNLFTDFDGASSRDLTQALVVPEQMLRRVSIAGQVDDGLRRASLSRRISATSKNSASPHMGRNKQNCLPIPDGRAMLSSREKGGRRGEAPPPASGRASRMTRSSGFSESSSAGSRPQS